MFMTSDFKLVRTMVDCVKTNRPQDEIVIPERGIVKFRAGKELKVQVVS